MNNPLLSSLNDTAAPLALSRPLQALWWLKKGDLRMGDAWETAHEICQSAEGDMAHDWVHGLAHWIEGDMGNAAYWYRRVGKERNSSIAADWDSIVAELAG
ncbi:MAG: hypothetical protein COA52_05060 [Hyphomicrobiales bacterium]|nr:hypothetical protein [Hyphomicrobiales bacterium]PCJ94668.1 MAG: hypothetical protein COA52_05060 [Hyphomicrobiales bacterium]